MAKLKVGEACETKPLNEGLPAKFTQPRFVRTALHNPMNILGVNDDIEAVGMWLRECGRNSPNTLQTYKREAEKLLVWASTVKGKGLGELTREDHLDFQEFLTAVPQDWIMTRRFKRNNSGWRPFLSQPSASSIAHSVTILYGMMEYLTSSGWFLANPMPKPKSTIRKTWRPTRKALSRDIVQIILDSTSESQVGESPKDVLTRMRDRWIVYFMVHMAPRVSETRSVGGNIRSEIVEGKTMWIWSLVGKGGRDEELPVPAHVMSEFENFRLALGLPSLPELHDKTPIFPSFRKMSKDGDYSDLSEQLTRNSIYKRITEHIAPRAKKFAAQRGVEASQLDLVSPHWLRHTALTEILRKSGDLQVARKLGRHRDINTTAGYTQTDLITLSNAMEE